MPAPTFDIVQDPLYTQASEVGGTRGDATRYTIRCTGGGPATANQALTALIAQFPMNSPNPEFAVLIAAGHKIVQIQSPNSLYVGEVSWAQVPWGTNPSPVDDVNALLNLPPRVESISSDFYQEPCEGDKFGDPIINSAGDPFDPPPLIDRNRLFLVLSKYKKSFVADTYKDFPGRLNDAAYVLPGVGSCAIRTVRVHYIRPAAGFNPVVDIPVDTVSGAFANGENVTWDSGGSATVVGLTGSTLRLMNLNQDVALHDVFASAGGGSARATSAIVMPPVKVLWAFEIRKTGFDYEVPDKGMRGWYNGPKLGHIFVKASHTDVSSPVLLRQGAPSDTSSFDTNHPEFTNWVTTEDKLAARVGAGNVTRRSSGGVDFLKFMRINDISFAAIGL